jgi:hypothetical protein
MELIVQEYDILLYLREMDVVLGMLNGIHLDKRLRLFQEVLGAVKQYCMLTESLAHRAVGKTLVHGHGTWGLTN